LACTEAWPLLLFTIENTFVEGLLVAMGVFLLVGSADVAFSEVSGLLVAWLEDCSSTGAREWGDLP